MRTKRITLFAGHYGSGKTNIAVNYALFLAKQGLRVSLGDLDIVNPYYRAKDSEKELSAAGVKVISSAYANSNVDVPAMPQEAYALTEDKTTHAVLDVGGGRAERAGYPAGNRGSVPASVHGYRA